jgi:signal transduction histidine kinase
MGHYFRAAMKEGGIAMSKISARRDMAIIAAVWFSSRRYFEANRQLLWRKAAEARLAEALARDLHDELGQYLNAMKLDAVTHPSAAACGPRCRLASSLGE